MKFKLQTLITCTLPSHQFLIKPHIKLHCNILSFLVSTYVVCERLSVMHKQVSGWTVNFCSNKFSRKPLSGISDQKAPPPQWKTSDLRWPKFTLEYPPPPPENWNLAISWHFEYFQFWHPTPCPPPKLKFSHLLALWVFSVLAFLGVGYQNWKCQFSHFAIPPKKFEILSIFSFGTLPPPPPERLAIREIVCGDSSVSPVDTTRCHCEPSHMFSALEITLCYIQRGEEWLMPGLHQLEPVNEDLLYIGVVWISPELACKDEFHDLSSNRSL